jgi:hypothetical protein
MATERTNRRQVQEVRMATERTNKRQEQKFRMITERTNRRQVQEVRMPATCFHAGIFLGLFDPKFGRDMFV